MALPQEVTALMNALNNLNTAASPAQLASLSRRVTRAADDLDLVCEEASDPAQIQQLSSYILRARQAVKTARTKARQAALAADRDALLQPTPQMAAQLHEQHGTAGRLAAEINDALRRTAAIVGEEIQRSNVAGDVVEESTRRLKLTRNQHAAYGDSVASGQSSLKSIRRTEWLANLVVVACFALFFIAAAYVTSRRLQNSNINAFIVRPTVRIAATPFRITAWIFRTAFSTPHATSTKSADAGVHNTLIRDGVQRQAHDAKDTTGGHKIAKDEHVEDTATGASELLALDDDAPPIDAHSGDSNKSQLSADEAGEGRLAETSEESNGSATSPPTSPTSEPSDGSSDGFISANTSQGQVYDVEDSAADHVSTADHEQRQGESTDDDEDLVVSNADLSSGSAHSADDDVSYPISEDSAEKQIFNTEHSVSVSDGNDEDVVEDEPETGISDADSGKRTGATQSTDDHVTLAESEDRSNRKALDVNELGGDREENANADLSSGSAHLADHDAGYPILDDSDVKEIFNTDHSVSVSDGNNGDVVEDEPETGIPDADSDKRAMATQPTDDHVTLGESEDGSHREALDVIERGEDRERNANAGRSSGSNVDLSSGSAHSADHDASYPVPDDSGVKEIFSTKHNVNVSDGNDGDVVEDEPEARIPDTDLDKGTAATQSTDDHVSFAESEDGSHREAIDVDERGEDREPSPNADRSSGSAHLADHDASYPIPDDSGVKDIFNTEHGVSVSDSNDGDVVEDEPETGVSDADSEKGTAATQPTDDHVILAESEDGNNGKALDVNERGGDRERNANEDLSSGSNADLSSGSAHLADHDASYPIPDDSGVKEIFNTERGASVSDSNDGDVVDDEPETGISDTGLDKGTAATQPTDDHVDFAESEDGSHREALDVNERGEDRERNANADRSSGSNADLSSGSAHLADHDASYPIPDDSAEKEIFNTEHSVSVSDGNDGDVVEDEPETGISDADSDKGTAATQPTDDHVTLAESEDGSHREALDVIERGGDGERSASTPEVKNSDRGTVERCSTKVGSESCKATANDIVHSGQQSSDTCRRPGICKLLELRSCLRTSLTPVTV